MSAPQPPLSAAEPTPGAALAELPEAQASGEIASIYAELRAFCAVPYVSSLQRHLATMPGCLEYLWAVCRTAFVGGRIPQTAWHLSSGPPGAPFPPLSPAALRLLGVDDASVGAIRNICDNFVRVAPINILFSGVVQRLLEGEKPGGNATAQTCWQPPAMLPPMPGMTELAALPADQRAVLMQLATAIGGRPFVPGLYRLLAGWPGYLAHTATLVAPLLRDDAARAARATIAQTILAAAGGILAGLPPAPSDLPAPGPEQIAAIIGAIQTYRVTSPEMIVIGTLLRDALPDG